MGHHWRRNVVFRNKADLAVGIVALVGYFQRRNLLCLLGVVDFPEIKNLAFDHPTLRADTFHHTPLAVWFFILESLLTLEVHARIHSARH